jgi:hypothetical protein
LILSATLWETSLKAIHQFSNCSEEALPHSNSVIAEDKMSQIRWVVFSTAAAFYYVDKACRRYSRRQIECR